MKKKVIILIIIILVLFIFIITYIISLKRIDTKYAKNFSNVFGSYNIERVDRYLDNETIIKWKDKTATYSKLRDNVIQVFNEKEYKLTKDSSYGNGNDKFIDNVEKIFIEVHIFEDFGGEKNKEMLVEMQIEKLGIYNYRVKLLESESMFFKRLFFGKK